MCAVEADGGVPQPGAEIVCGDELTCTNGDVCCIEQVPADGGRIYSFSDGTSRFLGCAPPGCAPWPEATHWVSCDGPEDCAAEQVCCGSYAIGRWLQSFAPLAPGASGIALDLCSARCVERCEGSALCHSDGDGCPVDQLCKDPVAFQGEQQLGCCGSSPIEVCFEVERVCHPRRGSEPAPAPATDLAGARMVSVYAGLACAITGEGRLVCWGSDPQGLGAPPAGRYRFVSVGQDNACAITTLGELVCWGQDTYCVDRPPSGSFVQVSVGWRHACALAESGEVACWGDDRLGHSITRPARRVALE